MSGYSDAMPPPLAGSRPPLTVAFGSQVFDPGNTFEVGLPILAGDEVEAVFPHARPAVGKAGFALFKQERWLLGYSVRDARGDIEPQTFDTYRELLDAVQDRHLCRIWNYVPGINRTTSGGIEVYRAFSRGRARAFEERFGPGFEQQLPAASAVGSDARQLVVGFAANESQPIHFENPQQVPAYEYPPQHGPRAPSFARATVVPRDDGGRDVFISGTAAIRGHETIAPGDTLRQLECTLENLREISQVCGLGSDLSQGRALVRHIKVYLRDPDDLASVSKAVDNRLIGAGDRVTWLKADICRFALKLEIEATVIGAVD